MAKNYEVDIEKQEIIFNEEKLTPEELLEIANLQKLGYRATKQSTTKGHNKAWFLGKLPDDKARARFNELCDSEKGLEGYRKATKWARDTYPKIFPTKTKSKNKPNEQDKPNEQN